MKTLRVTNTVTDSDGTKVSVERVMPKDADCHIYADATDVLWVHTYAYGDSEDTWDERECAVSLGASTIRLTGKSIKELFVELNSKLEDEGELAEESVV